jgi:NAD(P)-dependent dehydrogenase (short-subunit alcohol dehydrogenase family)
MTNSIDASHGRGRVALVTGAAGILGPTICSVLRRDGWRVAATDVSEQAFAHVDKLFGRPVEADCHLFATLQGRESCRNLVRQVEQQLGPIGLLVNNAATNPHGTALQELDEAFCRMMLETNLLAPLWLCQAAEPSLVSQRGSIINVSSVRVCRPGSGAIMYPVTKAALESLTVTLAMQLGPKGVRVNAIRVGTVPGPAFLKPVLEKLSSETARRLLADVFPGHWANDGEKLSTTGRAGIPADVAEAVSFLASSRAEFFNAAILPLEGGLTFRIDEPPAKEGEWDSRRAVAEWLAREGIKL